MHGIATTYTPYCHLTFFLCLIKQFLIENPYRMSILKWKSLCLKNYRNYCDSEKTVADTIGIATFPLI